MMLLESYLDSDAVAAIKITKALCES